MEKISRQLRLSKVIESSSILQVTSTNIKSRMSSISDVGDIWPSKSPYLNI